MKIPHESKWAAEVPPKIRYPQLKQDISCDVVIIGGGITGLVTGYLLSKTHLKIVLIEKDELYSGATAATTAFITQAVDTSLAELTSIFGAKKGKLVWQSGAKAIDLIEKIIKQEKIDCDFMRCPAFLYSLSSEDTETLIKDAKVAKKLGFKIKFNRKNNLGFVNSGFLEIKNQAKFHPLKFLSKLAKVIVANGVKIYEQTEALEVAENLVRTKFGVISAEWVVIATHLPFNNPIQTFMKKGKYLSYILEAKIPKHSLKEAIYMDTEVPYHYFRIDKDSIILGGEDHRAELDISETKIYSALENYLKQILPGVKYQLTREWAGPIIESSDGIALIGKISDSILLATGYSGNGMTYSTIAGMMFKDIISGRKNPWISLYDPTRIPKLKALWKKGLDYTQEFINVAVAHTISKKTK